MSFSPEQSDPNKIEAFELLQSSFSQLPNILLPLVILASPFLALQLLQNMIPMLGIPIFIISGFFIAPLIIGASVYFFYRYLSTQTSDLGGAIEKALGKSENLILGYILYAIAIAAGLSFLAIPGIYVAVRLGFVIHAIVIDELDAVSALKLSWNLVEGRWVTVAGAQLLIFIISFVPSFIIGFVVGLTEMTMSTEGMIIATILQTSVEFVVGALATIYITNLYLRLKELTE